MKVSKETTEKCEVILTVEVDDSKKQKLMQKAARRIAKAVRVPGFRPGKAPYSIIVNQFGEEAIRDEAIEDLTTDVYQKAVEEAEVTPYAPASLEDVQWEPLTMKIRIPTEPEIELGDYRAIRVEVEEVPVEDEEVEHQLGHLRERFTTYNPVERAAQLGDMVSVSITEHVDGAEDATPRDRDMELAELAEDDSNPDYASAIVGKTTGETATLSHTYADDYFDEKFAGKTVEYSIAINEVKEKEEIPLDDDFAALVGDYETLDDLKTKIREDLQTQKDQQRDGKVTDDILDQIVAVSSIKWPQILEEQELDNAVANQRTQLKQYGIDLPIFLTAQNMTEEQFREDMRESVQKNLKNSLVMGKIVEAEKLTVAQEEIINEANQIVSMSGGAEETLKAIQSDSGMRTIANNLLTEKIVRRLLSIAKGEAEAETDAEADGNGDSVEDTAVETVAESADESKSETEE